MSIYCYDAWTDLPMYKTTFIVPIEFRDLDGNVEPVTHHTHFSLGPRVEGSVREMSYRTHRISECRNPRLFQGDLVRGEDVKYLTLNGLPIEQVSDWTEQEAELLSGILCPMTPERHQLLQLREAQIREAILNSPMSSWAEEMDEEDRLLEHQEDEDEDFPLEFEDDGTCPVCLEEEYPEKRYLLRLPCGHTLCKGCLKNVQQKCPKCRKEIDKSLIKRRK